MADLAFEHAVTYVIVELVRKKVQNTICSLGPGDYDCGCLILQFVIFRKL